jgi:DNA mismatch repair protein MutS
LTKPAIWETEKHLILSHDSINQLNLIPNLNTHKSGISSLWDILDKTSTPLGKRYLKNALLNPIIDSNEITNTYDVVSELQTKYKDTHIFKLIEQTLKSINDIQRLHRKMALKNLQPYEFISLDTSYSCIKKIISLMEEITKNNPDSIISNEIPTKTIQQELSNLIVDYNQKIKMNEMLGVNLNNINDSFFRRGVYTDIDKEQDKLKKYKEYFDAFAVSLGATVDNSGKTVADIKHSDKEDYFLTLTKSKAKILQSMIKKNSDKIVTFNNGQDQFKLSDLELKNTTTHCKVFSGEIKQNSHLRVTYENRVKNMCIKYFTELAYEYYTNYSVLFDKISSFISRIDFLSCAAKVSLFNGYSKPIINMEPENSFIDAIDLRHPIIEKLNENVKYIPNNVLLGKDSQNGILLYGVNAVGKSSYMKSVGLSIIMAQAGFFVPAEKFVYKPYKHLFTRISGNDNIFKNQSTFAVEMDELRTILRRGNNNSLVLGDELCSGTETTSGLALVTAGVVRLSTLKSSFIFATHLHKLSDMPEILECENVNNYHMETVYNEETEQLIYNRKLKEGAGNSIYGLEVAKAMKLDTEFLKIANKVRKRIMNVNESIVDTNTSVYNSSKFIEDCEVCGSKAEEVHHIKEQHMADENGMIGTFHKNKLHNLTSLCHNCHHEVHHGKLFIEGYVDTSDGVKLLYKYNNLPGDSEGDIKKKKFSQDQMEIIKDIHSKLKKFTQTKTYLENNKGIKISTTTIKKIVNNQY